MEVSRGYMLISRIVWTAVKDMLSKTKTKTKTPPPKKNKQQQKPKNRIWEQMTESFSEPRWLTRVGGRLLEQERERSLNIRIPHSYLPVF